METATDQDILAAAQERLIKKRQELGVTNSPIRLMVPAQSKPADGETEQEMIGRLVAQTKEREAAEEAEKQKSKNLEMQERKADPGKWLRRYGIPSKYLNASYQSFTGGEKAKQMCRAFPGKDIVLHGKTGCGKTHLAAATLREMVEHDTIAGMAKFITVPNLLMEIRDSFKDRATETEKAIVTRYTNYAVLIMDDLGADRGTEWAIETLYLIIDGRDAELRPTFITTNLSLDEIEAHYGARIASRIAGKNNFNIDMPDYRKRR